ncbi:hypothetical protein [Streptacidiphilus anmyonensis]|uniref:hypothetical protein n=1 Tax=Streptacidiphilus anmyonensis TaxID=405782 RepID=UPI000A9EE613|nr:hypothetical protein [Streptacidiphilus anmyonensis]
MASANVTFHLADQAHLVPAGHAAPWWLTTFVVLIFVAVIWRVHTLMHDDGTDGHDSPDTTPVHTSTGARTDGAKHARTTAPGASSYGPSAGTPTAANALGPAGTPPVHAALAPTATNGTAPGVTSAYTGRTSGVQAQSAGAPSTGTEHSGRTGTAAATGGGRTSTVHARTAPASGVPGARTGTASSRPRTTQAAIGRTSTTPARTDEELLPAVQALPREDDGFVNVSRARTELSVNQPRAVRLLAQAGLLRPDDADKYLT